MLLDKTFFFFNKTVYLNLKVVKLGRLVFFLYFFLSTGFIKNINRFVWKKTLWNIAAAQPYNCRNNVIVIHNSVKMLVLRFYSLKNFYGIFVSRFFNVNFLKTPRKRRILFDVAAVFFCSSSADKLKFTAAKRRFQHIRRIHLPFRTAGTDNRMEFVNKKNDVF